MKRIILLAAILFVFSDIIKAQTIQSKACPFDPVTILVQPCAFDNPVAPGDMLVVILFGCDPARFNDPPHACDIVSDTQGNVFQTALAIPSYGFVPLVYSLDVKGGTDTVTFKPNVARFAIIVEYPPSSGLDDVGWRSYSQDNLHEQPGASNDVGWAGPVEATQSGELLIAWGWSGGPIDYTGPLHSDPGSGFTIRNQIVGSFVLEDMWTAGPGLYIGSVHWGGYAHWVLGVAAFKVKR